MIYLNDTLSAYIEKNPALKRLFRNVAIIFSGNIISSVIGLFTLMILTRALPLETFGYYALIIAFIGLIDRLTSFQTWQALIHFGAHAREKKDKPLLMSLFTFGWLLDTSSGIIGFIIACLTAIFAPQWFGLDVGGANNALIITAIAGTVLLFNWTSTPTAVLRLYDKFYAQALYQKITASIIFIGTLALSLSNNVDVHYYIIVWAFGTIIGRILFLSFAIREIKKQNTWRISDVSMTLLFSKTEGLWKYVITTNLDGIVRVLRDLDIFFVNAVLGAAAAGLYKVARRITLISGQLMGPFYQAIYPELAKLRSEDKRDDFKRLMIQSSLTIGSMISVVFVAFIMTGWFLIPLVFGAAYQSIYILTMFCMAGQVIAAFSQPLSPAMLACGNVRLLLILHIASTIIYAVSLYYLIELIGLSGAGLSLFLFYAVWGGLRYIAFTHKHKS